MTSNIFDFLQMLTKRKIFLIFIIVISGSITNAQNDSIYSKKPISEYKWERFSFSFGGFATALNSQMQIGSKDLGVGVIFDVEDALGLKTSATVLRSGLEYNYGKKRNHSVILSYFGVFRNATKILDSAIVAGDAVFPVGTEVSSKYNMQIFRGSYSYIFYKDERVKLGLSAGLFIIPINFTTTAIGLSSESAVFVAPLPVAGFRTSFAITPKIAIKQNIELLYLSFENFTGSITDLNILIDYSPFKHFGIGAGVNMFNLNLSARTSSSNMLEFEGNIKSSYTGLLIYGRFYF